MRRNGTKIENALNHFTKVDFEKRIHDKVIEVQQTYGET